MILTVFTDVYAACNDLLVTLWVVLASYTATQLMQPVYCALDNTLFLLLHKVFHVSHCYYMIVYRVSSYTLLQCLK